MRASDRARSEPDFAETSVDPRGGLSSGPLDSTTSSSSLPCWYPRSGDGADRTVLLCIFPEEARYNGVGDVNAGLAIMPDHTCTSEAGAGRVLVLRYRGAPIYRGEKGNTGDDST
jgi:hypothetical protein